MDDIDKKCFVLSALRSSEKCKSFLPDDKGLWQKLSSYFFLLGGKGQNFGNVKMYDAKFNIKRHIWANEDDLFYHFAL